MWIVWHWYYWKYTWYNVEMSMFYTTDKNLVNNYCYRWWKEKQVFALAMMLGQIFLNTDPSAKPILIMDMQLMVSDKESGQNWHSRLIWIFGAIFIILPPLLYFTCQFCLALTETANTLGCLHISPSTIIDPDCQNINRSIWRTEAYLNNNIDFVSYYCMLKAKLNFIYY